MPVAAHVDATPCDDDDSAFTGTRVAQRMLETTATHGVELEVFCLGPAQRRIGCGGSEADTTFDRQLQELSSTSLGVPGWPVARHYDDGRGSW